MTSLPTLLAGIIITIMITIMIMRRKKIRKKYPIKNVATCFQATAHLEDL